MRKNAVWLRRAAAAATIALLLALGWMTIDIYSADEFSREMVSAGLSALRWPAAGYAILIAAAAFVQARVPAVPPRNELTPENRLRLARAGLCELPPAAASEEQLRRKIVAAAAGAMAVSAAFCIRIFLDEGRFASWDLEMVMADVLLSIAPWIAVGFGAAAAGSFACERSIRRELTHLRGGGAVKAQHSVRGGRGVNAVRAVIISAGIVLVVLGSLNGGAWDVLVKAVNICTECIGLG